MISTQVALQGGAAAAAAAPALYVAACKDPCAPRLGTHAPRSQDLSCRDATTGSCGVGARVELQDLAAAHAAPHNGKQGSITAVGDRFQVDFDAGGPNFPFVNPANLKPLCEAGPATSGCGVGDRVMLQDLEAAHAVGYNGAQGTVTEITEDNRLKVAFDSGEPKWPTINPANLRPLCGPLVMPKSCAAGLPGFDPSDWRACNGDCSKAVQDAMKPKFSFGKGFSLGKIKIKF